MGIIVLFIILPEICAADAPHNLGGFVLGGKIEDFRDKIKTGTELPVRYAESLKEAEVLEIPGFKTGLVYYGTCEQPSLILRVEFKYDDSSKKFYEVLLKRFKNRHGDPDEWRGDLILKHNTRDEEKKEGNSVKMTMWNLMNKEIRCYKEKQPSPAISSADDGQSQEPSNIDWDLLVPR
jgi:hypothetical protein